MEVVLAMFGTDVARENFKQLCKQYIEVRNRAIHESYAPDTSVRHHAVTSGPKQAVLHNQIMDAIYRLGSQSVNMSPTQNAVIQEMADRDATVAIIKDYEVAQGVLRKEDDADDEEPGGRKKGVSDIAYYRSLSKGG